MNAYPAFLTPIVLLALLIGVWIGVVITNLKHRRLDEQRRLDIPVKDAACRRADRGRAVRADSADELPPYCGRDGEIARIHGHGCAE